MQATIGEERGPADLNVADVSPKILGVQALCILANERHDTACFPEAYTRSFRVDFVLMKVQSCAAYYRNTPLTKSGSGSESSLEEAMILPHHVRV